MSCEPVGDICPRPGDTDNNLLRKILLSLNEVGDPNAVPPTDGLIEVVNSLSTTVNSLSMTPAESAYWRDQAALLDPKAFTFIVGSNIAVPAGESWFATEIWGYDDAVGNRSVYLRENDINRSLLLPGGTVLVPDAGTSHAYVCKPAVVWAADSRYNTGPSARELYYSRLARLKTLPLFTLTAVITSAQPFGDITTVAFPADFTFGLVTSVSSFQVAWTALNGPAESCNLWSEVNDTHEMQSALALRVPFNRPTTFPNIRARTSTQSGTTGVVNNGFGQVCYHKLPTDW